MEFDGVRLDIKLSSKLNDYEAEGLSEYIKEKVIETLKHNHRYDDKTEVEVYFLIRYRYDDKTEVEVYFLIRYE